MIINIAQNPAEPAPVVAFRRAKRVLLTELDRSKLEFWRSAGRASRVVENSIETILVSKMTICDRGGEKIYFRDASLGISA